MRPDNDGLLRLRWLLGRESLEGGMMSVMKYDGQFEQMSWPFRCRWITQAIGRLHCQADDIGMQHTVKNYLYPIGSIGFLDPGYPLRCFRDDTTILVFCQSTDLASVDN